MGYRTRLMKLPKHRYLEYKDKREDELLDFYFTDIPDLVELYEIGKSWDFDDTTYVKNFFTDRMGWEDDIEFSIASKEFLLGIIDNYTQKVINYTEKLFNSVKDSTEQELREFKLNRILGVKNDTTNLGEIQSYFRFKLSDWKTNKPYCLNEDTDTIVTSYTYEYIVFELVKILKDFDWENDILIWSGS